MTPRSSLKAKHLERLVELIATGEQLSRSLICLEQLREKGQSPKYEELKSAIWEPWLSWVTSATTLLLAILPADHVQVNQTKYIATINRINEDYHRILLSKLRSIKDDYERGFFDRAALLIHAAVATDYMEQATLLFEAGYHVAATVLSGAVLEDTLRTLCIQKNLSTSDQKGKRFTIEPLNVELARAGVYNVSKQKEITAWAGLRNDAAHNNNSVDREAVGRMLVGIQTFVGDHLW